MSVSTLTLTPGTTAVPGAGANAQPPTPGRRPAGAHQQAHARATTPNYHQWLSHVYGAAGCTHPIRLAGHVVTIEADTGRLLAMTSTEGMPDGVIYKNCGNRRSTVCPSCAETYRRDAFELIRTGLVGGKTVPTTIATHPAVFITLTAPGFGPVHTRRTSRDGRTLACRPRRQPDPCPHGVDLRCHRLHAEDEHALGTPLCPDCYDHNAQVVWNHQAGELWRRTRIALDRTFNRQARAAGIDPATVKLRYAKVAEMQRRGVVHFHAILRLDGAHPDLPGLILPPPGRLGADDLEHAVTAAVTGTTFTTRGHPDRPDGWPIGWGEQLDIRPIRLAGDGDLSDSAAAGYLAKYATKSTEATGHTSRRLDLETIGVYANPAGTHPERLVHACWTLGRAKPWAGLRRWAHMLGYGGHFLTKARHYSLTFGQLRQRRTTWQRQQQQGEHDQETTLKLNWLTYTGAGWRTSGDALLANTAAAKARERRQAARDELATTHRPERNMP